jgi:glycosyltransferase involved in cell wall biosynthesis
MIVTNGTNRELTDTPLSFCPLSTAYPMGTQLNPRVLLCSDYLPPSDGGVEQVVQNLALQLVESGFQVGVFTLDSGSESFDLREMPEVEFYSCPSYDLTDTIGLQSMVSPSALNGFRHALQEFQPDIVHAHNRFFFTSFLAAIYSRVYEYDLVTTLHLGSIDDISGVGGTAARIYERLIGQFIVRSSAEVICVSRAVEDVATSLSAHRTSVIRNAVDVDEFTPRETSSKSLLYIGRLVRNNGIQDLVDALPAVLEEHPDAEIHLLGSGPLEDSVSEGIRSNDLGDTVILHDYVEDISEMYDNASVFCRPSYSEGLPLTMLESMASGVPPVVTNVAGVPEVVSDCENGRLLTPGDPDEIAMAIIELFSSDELRSELAANAREYVTKNLTWNQRTERVIKVYEHLQTDE